MIAERSAGLDLNGHGEMENDRYHVSTVDGRFHFINLATYDENATGWLLVEVDPEDGRETISPREVAESLYDNGTRWWAHQTLTYHTTFDRAYQYAKAVS